MFACTSVKSLGWFSIFILPSSNLTTFRVIFKKCSCNVLGPLIEIVVVLLTLQFSPKRLVH